MRTLKTKHLISGLASARLASIAVPNPSLILSIELFLIYVLRASGCHGRLTSGRVERTSSRTIDIYNETDTRLDYFSGDRLRSWCVLNQDGMPHEDWKAVQSEDVDHMISSAMRQRSG